MTRQLLARLDAGGEDDVVEFAPGLGGTARLTLTRNPRSYIGIDREPAVARRLTQELGNPSVRFSASLVYGEAMLSMQTPEQKRRIPAEAFRALRTGGRYGIDEPALGRTTSTREHGRPSNARCRCTSTSACGR